MTSLSLHKPVMELIRAALDPAAEQARTRRDSPVCQVVIRAAEADLAAGGLDHVNQLAVGAGVAAAGLTSWLAQERKLEPTAILAEIEREASQRGAPTHAVTMLRTLLTGPPGMQQTAEFMVRLFHDDEEAYYDLIVDLGSYIALCIGMLHRLGISSPEQTLDDLTGMLHGFYTA